MRTVRALALPILALACSSDNKTNPIDLRPLGSEVPYTTDTVELTGLSAPVDVVRDQFGMIHIYASSVADAALVEGYQVGRDRTVQLELIRRFSEGTVAETFGDASPSLIDSDIAQRTLGLTRVAKKTYDGLAADSDERRWLDAYASGVSQLYARVQGGDIALPRTIVGFQPKFLTPWTGTDSLAIARYQAQNLSFTADDDVARTELLAAMKKELDPQSMDAARKARASMFLDVMRFEPIDHTTTLPGFPNDTSHTQGLDLGPRAVSAFRADPALLAQTRAWRDAMKAGEAFFGDKGARGSNNWMVSAKKSATGHAMIASDPHLSLTSPAVFWMVQLDVKNKSDPSKDVDAAGLAFPGIPGIILGFNERVAWGATTAYYDVTDVYQETLTQSGGAVSFKNTDVPIQRIKEPIAVANGPTVDYEVLYVPHHGPIIPTIDPMTHTVKPPGASALSYRWTGLEPTREVSFVIKMMYAKSVEDVRVAARDFGVGAQNWVSADVSGDVFYTSQSIVPKRDPRALQWDATKYAGTLPLFVLPGDGTCEWTGAWDEAYIPHAKNPAEGFLATANNDQVGTTLDNDPSNEKLPNGDNGYLGAYTNGLRVGRILERLRGAKGPLTPDDLASIQGDARSPFGARLAPKLIEMIDHAEQERANPGAHPDLAALVASPRYAAANVSELRDWLVKWGTDSDYAAESGVGDDDNKPIADPQRARASQATLLFNAWLVRMNGLVFDDELKVLGKSWDTLPGLWRILAVDPQTLGTYDPASGQSALFDDISTPMVKETRDERGVTALLDAVDMLSARLGADRGAWRWGALHTIRFTALVSFWSALSIPPAGDAIFPNGFPRHGDNSTVDVANFPTRAADFMNASFAYGSGPTQRFVIDMDPKGPVAKNALPGGAVWDTASPHFRDDAERWRRNQTRPVLFARADVIKDALDHKDIDERITYVPKK